MHCNLMIVGNEILNGKTQDVHIRYLGQELVKQHMELAKVEIVADRRDELIESFSKVQQEKQLFTIVTGGLGLTQDDLTKHCLAQAIQSSLIPDKEAAQILKRHYQRRQLDRQLQGHPYTFVPEGCQALYNPVGLAPGIAYTPKDKHWIFLLPGVPSELKAMFQESVVPLLRTHPSLMNRPQMDRVTVRTKMIPEERIFTEIAPKLWNELGKIGNPSSLPHTNGVDIGVSFEYRTHSEQQEKKKQIIEAITSVPVLKKHIWQIGEDSLEERVIKIAKQQAKTLAIAESCTGGLMTSMLTDVAGSSQILKGGACTYATEMKTELLGVDPKLLAKFGVVSKEVAEAMALGVRHKFTSDFSLATTGIAGPDGGTEKTPIGTIAVGYADQNGAKSWLMHFGQQERKILKTRFAIYAFFQLLEVISGEAFLQ